MSESHSERPAILALAWIPERKIVKVEAVAVNTNGKRRSASLTLESVISTVRDQVSCDLQDEIVILDLRGGVYYGLNSVAARVWQLLRQPCSVKQIRDTILTEYDVAKQDCTEHLLDLLSDLRGWNLIQIQNDSSE